MRIFRNSLIFSILTFACGCGGAPAATTPAEADSNGAALSDAQKSLVGEYATADGAFRVIVDRHSKPARFKIDGSDDIVELTIVERPSRRGDGGWDLRAPDGKRVLFLDSRGGLGRIDGSKEISLMRIGDAAPLADPTVAGQYVEPPSSYDLASAKFEAISVLKKLSGFRPEDSGNLTKVRAAFDAATPDMLVRFVWTHDSASKYRPAPSKIGNTDHSSGGYYPSDETFSPSKGGLRAHGVVVDGSANYNGRNRLLGLTPKKYGVAAVAQTPALIWEVDSSTIVFITPDGGRYTTNISGVELEKGGRDPFAPGWPAVTAWPKPLQHTRLDADDVELLAKGSSLPTNSEAPLEKIDGEFSKCVSDVFADGKKAQQKLEEKNINWSAKRAQLEALAKTYEAKATKSCKKHAAAYEKTLLALIEARNKERQALYKHVKAKLGTR